MPEHPKPLPPLGGTHPLPARGSAAGLGLYQQSVTIATPRLTTLKIDHLDLGERKPEEIKRGSEGGSKAVNY